MSSPTKMSLTKKSKALKKEDWRVFLKTDSDKFGEGAVALKGLRFRDGLTQQDLADKLEIYRHHISEMENGKRSISKEMAKKLGHVFNTNYKLFLEKSQNMNEINSSIISICNLSSDYYPGIVGEIKELRERIDAFGEKKPNATNFFRAILDNNKDKLWFLEDWLLIPHFQFFWDKREISIEYYEEQLDLLSKHLSNENFELFLADALKRTDVATTNDLTDRLYDIGMEIAGAIYLIKQGYEQVHFIPRIEGEKTPDIFAKKGDQELVMECTFLHSSDKFRSYLGRYNFMLSIHVDLPNRTHLIPELIEFPSSKDIKALPLELCRALNNLYYQIMGNPSVALTAKFEELTFEYSPNLPLNLVTITDQQNFANEQGETFALTYLKRCLQNKAIPQLTGEKYKHCSKIFFIGFQPDKLYLAPWNEQAIYQVKSTFMKESHERGIQVIFSENVGFGVRGYL